MKLIFIVKVITMTKQLNHYPFDDAPVDGKLPDGCGLFERYYYNGQWIDLCGASPDPNDYETIESLYKKVIALLNAIIKSVDLNADGTYKPSSDDDFPLISSATTVKNVIEMISDYVESLQADKFDKVNLKMKYDNGVISLLYNDKAYTSVNIPEEQFLDSEETKFITLATSADKLLDPSVVLGKPYLKLVFKTIDDELTATKTYTYIPMSYLFNVYTVSDTNSINMEIRTSGDTYVLSSDINLNMDRTNAIKIDNNGVYVKDLSPIIEGKIESLTEGNGINIIDTSTPTVKSYELKNKISTSDKILASDSNGLNTSLGMTISGDTISLVGKNNQVISSIDLPESNLTFTGTSGVSVTKTGNNVKTDIVLDTATPNILTKNVNGLRATLSPFSVSGNNVTLNGNITSNKFIANGKTSADILLGDGSTININDLLTYIAANIKVVPNLIPKEKLSLAGWSINPTFEGCFTNFLYDPYKYQTTYTFKGIGGYEQLFLPISVQPYTDYTWQYNVVKLENTTSSSQINRTFRGYVAFSTPNLVDPWGNDVDQFLGYQDLTIRWDKPVELSDVAKIEFNTDRYSTIWLGWNMGTVSDSQTFKIVISNIMLSPGLGVKAFTPMN